MLVWHEIEAGCPICAVRLILRRLGGGFATGQDSDLLVRMDGQHIIQAEIHTCPRCRYSGFPEDFEVTIHRSAVERFLADVHPKLVTKGTGGPTPDLLYEWAYRCARFLGKPDRELGLLLLRAYWCLRLPPSCDLPEVVLDSRKTKYLSGSVHHLRQALEPESPPHQSYLLGELNRRRGEFAAAAAYFKRFLDSGSLRCAEVPMYLRLAAMKLLKSAEHCDPRDRTMEEIVYADSPE